MRRAESPPYEYVIFLDGQAYPLLSHADAVPLPSQQPDYDNNTNASVDDDSLGDELRDKQIIRRIPFMNLAFIVTNCTHNTTHIHMHYVALSDWSDLTCSYIQGFCSSTAACASTTAATAR